MAPPQACQKKNKLVEVSKDGFALLDEFYSCDPMKSQAYDHDHNHHQRNHHNQQSFVYWGPQVVTVRKPVINSNQTAQFYGGSKIVDHHHHQHDHHNQQSSIYWGPQVITVRKPVINNNQAAQLYGGMKIVDHPHQHYHHNQ